jgi:tRNA-2-methylthio-N6-dimethylallyladenosine synthase
MNTYHIWTVGCQVNVADSGKLAAGLHRLGWSPTDRPDDADFIVVNTCAVRQNAEDRAAAKLSAMAYLKRDNPNLKIAVMGCMVGPRTEHLQQQFPYVDVFAQPQHFDDVISVLDLPQPTSDLGGEFWPDVFPDSDSHDAAPTTFVPIVEGCNKFCTYCIVPFRRGRERSRPIDEIAREVRAHTDRGIREVTLLGQTVEAYGKDQPPVDSDTTHADLYDLMAAIHDTPNLHRIRALTSYPPDMTDRILEGMATLPKVCESFSLPVQSGDDEILARMRRGYTVDQFVERVRKVRSLMPNVGISTDIIVGSPGETDAHSQNTLDLLTTLRFDKVHVATYSVRPGTYAARHQPDDVPAETKSERLHAIEELQRLIGFEKNHALFGQTVEVLVESRKPTDSPNSERLTGRTRTNKLVHFNAPIDTAPTAAIPTGAIPTGALVDVKIAASGAWALQGELASELAPEPAATAP